MARSLVFDAPDEAATAALGRALAELLPCGAVVGLCGPLGAGKTRLIQAIAAAAGVDPQLVVSPTFVLIHEYAGRVPIFHCDAYRLRDADEFLRLGADEYFNAGGWTLIEWADRVPSALPADRLEIRIEPTGPTARRFEFTTTGPHHEPLLAVLKERMKAEG